MLGLFHSLEVGEARDFEGSYVNGSAEEVSWVMGSSAPYHIPVDAGFVVDAAELWPSLAGVASRLTESYPRNYPR